MKKGLVLFGAPGSGKGTQSTLLSEKLNIPLISMGQFLRAEVMQKTSLGQKIENILKRGEYLSTEDVIEVLKEQLFKYESNWIILDGVPRSFEQAEAVEKYSVSGLLRIEIVILLKISPEKVLERIRKRSSCVRCQKDYCQMIDVCTVCGAREFVKRSDDEESVVLKRLQVFDKSMKDILDFYYETKRLHIIQADQSVEHVYADILKFIFPLMNSFV
ncbi:adenylate kinase family protein [Holospora curviuscula]|uniref:Adenylate kinase n=1 Tax=Holospora curviuscula TaxID=1082868 RepID=A0A2S5R8J6_9PROT|nr:nucleoside monophosphate kinase [Holospora curviuscula]PPE03638.1 adenylate kinase [Holospora curviuscula]